MRITEVRTFVVANPPPRFGGRYFIFVKLRKQWMPKTIRQTLAATRMFYTTLLGQSDWTLFGQIPEPGGGLLFGRDKPPAPGRHQRP